jgi:hypothetical protein
MFKLTAGGEKTNPVFGIVAGIFPLSLFPTLGFCFFPFIKVFATRKST